jgi:hypothetical protein
VDSTGRLDPQFKYGFAMDFVSAAAIQGDGRIVVGGYELVRLNSDGSLDTTFRPPELLFGSLLEFGWPYAQTARCSYLTDHRGAQWRLPPVGI